MTTTSTTDLHPSTATHSHPIVTLDLRLIGYAAGIAQYGVQLAAALARMGGPERYLALLGRRASGPSPLPSVRVQTPPHHRLERWALPLEVLAKSPRTALLHSIDHVAPRWGTWASVVTLHDLAFLRFPDTHTSESRAYYAATAESARRARRVIAVSESTASDAERLLGVPREKLRVIHEAAGSVYTPRPREELEQVAAQLQIDVTRPYILAVGTLEPRKNLPLLLEAFARLPSDFQAQLIVVGAPGWLGDAIFETHRRLGLGNSVRFVGKQDDTTLAVLYSHAAVFAYPSLYEGFGLPLLEAMACGAPVVASNAGPMPEVVGDAAILLPPEDPSTWATALTNVLGSPETASSLRARGFTRAAQFSWDRTAEQTRQVYREALGLAK